MESALGNFWILTRPAVPTQAHHAEEGFAKDATRHLAGSFATIDEDNADLLDFETNLIGSVFHLYLEGIALKANLVKFNGLQHTAAVALKTGCRIVYFKARHDADILRCEV